MMKNYRHRNPKREKIFWIWAPRYFVHECLKALLLGDVNLKAEQVGNTRPGFKIAKCICLNFKIYLFKFQNVFVRISKYLFVCLNVKMYLSDQYIFPNNKKVRRC